MEGDINHERTLIIKKRWVAFSCTSVEKRMS